MIPMRITPEFMRRSFQTQPAEQEGNASHSEAAEGNDALTLEFNDTPFKNLIRSLDQLPPREALQLLKDTLDAKIYTGKDELLKLAEKLDETLTRVRLEGLDPEEEERRRTLQGAFSRSAYALPAPTVTPTAMQPAPAMAAAPGISL